MKNSASIQQNPVPRGYLRLKKGLRFVSGPRRSAIYELATGKIYSVDPFTTRILSLGLKNVPVEDIPRRLRLGPTSSRRRWVKAFLEHPFVRISPRPNRQDLLQPAPPPKHLEFLWIELTATCNLRCQHCYASSGPDRAPGKMAKTDHSRLLAEAAELGCESVQFTGGEIFLRDDLIDLIGEARSLGFKQIELYTNATLVREKDLDFLKENRVGFAVSLYSHRPESHDAITLVPGSWKKTVASIRRILAREIPLRIGVVRMEENWGDLEGTRKYLEELGIPESQTTIDTVRPSGRGCEGGLSEPERSLIRLGPPSRFRPENGRLTARTCWNGKLAVDPDGNVFPCVFSRGLPVGNVKTGSLREVTGGESLQSLWEITLEDVEDCRDCEYRYACFDCRLQAFARTGRILAKPPTCAYLPHEGDCERAEGMPIQTEALPAPTLPRPRSSVSLRLVDGEALLYDRESRAMHILNPTAARIWKWCDGKATRAEIIEKMAAVYAASLDQISRDVCKTLSSFQEMGLLE